MGKRVCIFDTSVLCCLLQVPNKETAGAKPNVWDFARASTLVENETARKSTFVLPLASIIETGNHIAQARGDNFAVAQGLATIISKAAEATSPWAAFTDQADLWGAERLKRLASDWPELASGGLSIGDATIKDVAEYYAKAGYDVEIVTGDEQLKAYEPVAKAPIPRRRAKR